MIHSPGVKISCDNLHCLSEITLPLDAVGAAGGSGYQLADSYVFVAAFAGQRFGEERVDLEPGRSNCWRSSGTTFLSQM